MAKATTGAQVLGSEPAIEELIAEWKRSMKEGKDPFIIIPNGWDTPGEGRRKAGNKKILEAKQKRAKADAEKDVFKRKQLVEEADKLAAEGRKMGGSISREIDLELAQNIVANERILDARTAWLTADKRGDEVGRRKAEQEAREARKAGGTIPNCDLDEMKRMIGNQMILSSKIMWAEGHKDQDAAKKEQAEKLAAKGRAMGGTITSDDDLEDAQQMVANEMIWGAKQIWDDAQKTGGDASGAVASAKYAREKMGATITIDHSTEEAGKVVADNRSHAASKYSNSKGRAWNGMYNKADWENQAEQLYEQAGKPGGDKWAQDQLLLAEKILYGPPKEAESAKQKFDEAMKQKLEEAAKPNATQGATKNRAQTGGYEKFLELLAYHESRGFDDPYKAVNRANYLGRYQMGEYALMDAGFYKGDNNPSKNDFVGEWTEKAKNYGVTDRESFLNNPKAQEIAIRDYHKKQWDYLEKYSKYIGKEVKGVTITASGLLAGVHLVGPDAVRKFFETDQIPADGNKTPITTYMKDMGGISLKDLLGHDPDLNKLSQPSKTDSQKVTVIGNKGKEQYHVNESEVPKKLIDMKKQDLSDTHIKLTLVSKSPFVRQASFDALVRLAADYYKATGEGISITSLYRENDPDWHGTGYAIDIQTVHASIKGKDGLLRFPEGSKEKKNLEILIMCAIENGFNGIGHSDIDVINKVKTTSVVKEKSIYFFSDNNHKHHVHLSFVQ
ncbi:hypothetical protein [Paenibacillus oleatilyticus]|uniref:hypothetical protein n=1 Tax=Paenibacillus oleatilyticus TaxID=2594886 RepID=UPI001C1F6342|nr:hypothetical protein [Paenibacillus oleatilyticus]MBU7314283.1 hypothetical protein [Paenibacillus oleatilyticus]